MVAKSVGSGMKQNHDTKRGYVLVPRAIHDTGLLINRNALSVYLHCQIHAAFRAHSRTVGGTVVQLKPGQLATGRKILAEALCLTEQEVRSALTFLKKAKLITYEATSRYTLISITDWCNRKAPSRRSNQPPTNWQLRGNHSTSPPLLAEVRYYATRKRGNGSVKPEEFHERLSGMGWQIDSEQVTWKWKYIFRRCEIAGMNEVLGRER
jgi:hypothetical protein